MRAAVVQAPGELAITVPLAATARAVERNRHAEGLKAWVRIVEAAG